MANQKKCIDFYGERLRIGDEVIPVIDEAALIGIGGIITGIEYSEKYDNHFITISDSEGNVLLKNVDSRCYTTQERFDEREYSNYVFSLSFYNDKLRRVTTLPLTSRIDPDYEMPDNTRLVVLSAEHLMDEDNSIKSYYSKNIYTYLVEKDVKLYCDPKNEKYDYDFYYVINEDQEWYPIRGNFKVLASEEELNKYVKAIIDYFRKTDLSNINNDIVYKENDELKKFERRLVYRLNK